MRLMVSRFGAVEGTRRRASGSVGESSGGRSEPGGPSALSGASAERLISHSLSGRRVTRPVLHDSSARCCLCYLTDQGGTSMGSFPELEDA